MMSRTSGRYELKWSTGIKENGYHRFEVRTEDSLGNKATSAYYFKVENPDYGWLVILSLVILIVLVVAAVAVRGRKKRPEDLLPPTQEPETRATVQPSKEFPLAGPQPYEQPGQSPETPQQQQLQSNYTQPPPQTPYTPDQPSQAPYTPQQQPSSPTQQLAMQWAPEQPTQPQWPSGQPQQQPSLQPQQQSSEQPQQQTPQRPQWPPQQ